MALEIIPRVQEVNKVRLRNMVIEAANEQPTLMKPKNSHPSCRSIYLLQHVARADSNNEDVKVLGLYSSREKAALAVKRFRKIRGFSRYPDGFHIDQYLLNQKVWADGFEE